ncbi:MAG: SRPBCC domain-containing protein [Litoreibacter sp.]|uniref:SRPBCC family protein n=1 Tax=Litoreibacter sp. TaxID=1969459 RepID=UPI003298CD27
MTEATIRKSIYLKAPKATVWDYLTEPDKLAIWFHKPKVALADGQEYAMYGTESGDKLMWGNVVKAQPHDYLEYTFTIAPMGGATSSVKWTLEEVVGGTRLSLEHSGLPQGEDAFGLTLALDKGWDDHLGRMRADAHAD